MMLHDEHGFEFFKDFDKTPGLKVLGALVLPMIDFAKGVIVNKGLEFPPTMQTLDVNGNMATMEMGELFQPALDEVKHEILGSFLERIEADFYCLATEAWVLIRPHGSDPEKYRKGDASTSPDRISCLTIMGESIKNDTFHLTWRIDEGAKRKIDFGKPMHAYAYNTNEPNDTHHTGSMADLLHLRKVKLGLASELKH